MIRPASAASPRLRATLYLRQSTYREESISLELQEFEGRAYAERQGYIVVGVEADPGISGRTWNRPAVLRVMQSIEDGLTDVIVLWKWSRLSRSRLDWAVAADKVESAGGRIESATEPLDITTSTGRFARGMLTEFAAFESERIGDVWKEAHARRLRQGLPINGKPRFGYEYTREHGFTPDPISGPVLRETYARYIAGESIYSLVAWLNAGTTRPVGGYGVKTDGLWSDRTLRRVLDSGFAAGQIRSGGEVYPGVHESLITEHDWTTYQEARERRRTYRRTERSEYLLSGLVWCHCGSKMNAGQFGSNHTPKYRCKAAHEKRTHAGGYVTESVVNEFVHGWLVEREEKISAEIAAELASTPKLRAVVDPTARIRAKIAKLDARMDNLTARLIDTGIPHASFVRTRDAITAERDALEIELRTAQVRRVVTPIRVLPRLLSEWRSLEIPEKREYIRSVIAQVIVTPKRPRSSIDVLGRD